MKHLIVLLAALSLTACQYTEVTREIGYKGKARIDPWLAAERFAERMDWEAHSVISWTPPESGDAAWLVPVSILSNESFTRRMDDWVREGGHLILLVEHADPQTNDWSRHHTPPVLEPALVSMLRRAGIELNASGGASAERIRFEERRFEVEAESKATVAVSGGKPGVFASSRAGEGRISVLTDGRLFRNRWIGENDNAALFNALLEATEYEGRIGFMRGSGLSFWGMLTEHLWPVLLGLAALVLLWLWKNLTRFGPLEAEAPPPVLRGYEHHLEALGDFQWRVDRAASLLAPLREQITELGQRVSASAGRRDDDFFQFLADRAGLPRERVFRALAEAAPADSSILTRTAADLQQLLKVLHQPSKP
jgi:hypothetical protein